MGLCPESPGVSWRPLHVWQAARSLEYQEHSDIKPSQCSHTTTNHASDKRTDDLTFRTARHLEFKNVCCDVHLRSKQQVIFILSPLLSIPILLCQRFLVHWCYYDNDGDGWFLRQTWATGREAFYSGHDTRVVQGARAVPACISHYTASTSCRHQQQINCFHWHIFTVMEENCGVFAKSLIDIFLMTTSPSFRFFLIKESQQQAGIALRTGPCTWGWAS